MFVSLDPERLFLNKTLLTTYIPLYTIRYMNTLDKTILNVKLNKSLKHDAQELADELGVPLSTIVIANLKEFVRSRSITVSALPRLKPEIEKELGQAISDYKQSKNISPTLHSGNEVSKYLNSL